MTAVQEVLSGEIDSYAIIGTRDPDEAQAGAAYNLAFAIACIARKIVRTGGACGIDQKAMEGTQGRNLKVYLPWLSYNTKLLPATATKIVYDPLIHIDWTSSVTRFHPNANSLSRSSFALHARNFGIVHKCKAVIAFPQRDGSGGTGQGIRIAEALHIPVIQANKGSISDMPRWLGKVLQELGFASKDLAVTIQNRG